MTKLNYALNLILFTEFEVKTGKLLVCVLVTPIHQEDISFEKEHKSYKHAHIHTYISEPMLSK